MESNLLLEQYSWYKKQQLAKAPFECLLNADIEPNPHQVNAFCAAIQALKTGGIILADEVGLGKTIEAGLVLNYVLDNGAKKVLISLPATLRKQWEVELLEKFGRQAVILDRYTVEHDLANVQTHLGNADEVSIVIASYDYSSKLIKRFPHVKWDFLIIDEAHNLRNVFHGTKRAKNLYDLTHGIPKILLTATPLQNSLTDLHGLVSFIDPRIFGSEKVFNRRFVDGCDYEELKQELLRRYVGVCAPGQSVKTALLRVYSIILQSAYNLSLDDEYKDVIDPYYTLVGYYNSIRELGGAVRLLQDDIPDRIQRIKKKYGMSRQRFLNHKVEITSRMSSYDIPKKLSQLETPYTDRNCLDTAIATNMIAVGMDVDRLGLMVVTGQPKQNSEYIQATSRIGRSYPGLVVTLYNPYRPRDLSHYENFTGYHAQLYRFVEGTTATPFSARARDRVLHALVISAIRLHYPEFASNDGAAAIDKLTDEQLNEVKALIMNRLNIIKPSAKADAEHEIDDFISNWKLLATQSKELRYYVYTTKPRWKSNGVFFNRFFGGFVLRATLKSNFVASAMSCSIIEISLLRL